MEIKALRKQLSEEIQSQCEAKLKEARRPKSNSMKNSRCPQKNGEPNGGD